MGEKIGVFFPHPPPTLFHFPSHSLRPDKYSYPFLEGESKIKKKDQSLSSGFLIYLFFKSQNLKNSLLKYSNMLMLISLAKGNVNGSQRSFCSLF